MSKEKRKARWLFFGKDKYTYDTIAELVNKSMGLAVGEVVTLNGYYSAGDGAGHKRIIANEDDGSGVQLSNNLWANIVHNGEVNVSWFGCTSETFDQTDIVNKALEYCKGIIVLIIDKNLYIEEVPENGSVWVKYDGQIIKGINYPKITTNTKSSNPMKVAKKREHIISEESIKNVTIQGLNFIGFGGYEYYGMFKGRGLTIVNSEYCIVQDCKFSNWSMMGLDLISNSNGAIVTKNYFEFNGGYQCVAFNQAGNNSIFSNNIITSKYIGIDKTGSSLVQSTGNILIANNSFYIPQGYGGAGVVIGESQSTDVACVVGNAFNGGYVGINVLANACTNIGNNTIKNCEYGIRITDINDTVKVNHVKISDNMIINCNYGIMDINTKGIYEILNNNIIKYNTEEIFGENIWKQKSGFLGICLNDENGHIIIGNSCKNITNPYTININSDIIFKDNIGRTKISFISVKNFGYRIAYDDLDYVRKNKEIIYTSDLYPTIKGTIIGNKICKEMYILNLTDPQLVSEGIYSYETGIDLTSFYSRIFIQLLDSDEEEVLTNDFVGFDGTRIKLKNKNNYTKLMISHYVDYNLIKSDLVKLNSIYHLEKMKQEGVYNDYISYMDEKTVYDKQQRKLEQDKQLAYEQVLKENPNLTYEEFMSLQPMTLNLIEEPQPSEVLKKFMEKYL